jgi:hypothetical protein
MKRDLYETVSGRIVAELEAGAAPWIKPWSASPGANTPCNAATNRPYSGCNIVLLWMARAGYRTPRFLTFKQALELGGNVRKGEHGSKVFFVKQLQVRDKGAEDDTATRVVPMLREYTVFNVDQCENLSGRVVTLAQLKPRNADERDTTIDEFLATSGATIREGSGEAYYRPGDEPTARTRGHRCSRSGVLHSDGSAFRGSIGRAVVGNRFGQENLDGAGRPNEGGSRTSGAFVRSRRLDPQASGDGESGGLRVSRSSSRLRCRTTGRQSGSLSAWIFVVRPPRERPIA